MLQTERCGGSSLPEACSCGGCGAALAGGDPARREAGGRLGAAEGPDRGGEPRGDGAARGRGGDRRRGALVGKLGDVRYVYTWAGERIFKVVSFYLVRYAGGRLGDIPPEFRHEVAEARWLPLEDAPRLLAYRGEREMAEKALMMLAARRPPVNAMYALNFYSPIVADQLRTHRKTATIRLGDKSRKYKKGMVVSVLFGARYGPREKVFDAVIDKVEVKDLGELSPREIEHDNPEIRRPEEMAPFLGQLYNREVTEDDTVTVIRFSQIVSRPA